MKAKLNRIIVFILVIILSAVAAVTGFAVSAASGTTVSTRASAKKSEEARCDLKDGVWQALYKTGESRLFFINSEENSFSLINPDKGIGLPSQYEYLPGLGIYKLHIASEENTENWRVIENNNNTAAISNAEGDVITLFYLSNESIGTFTYYTLDELSGMARACYEKQYGSSEGIEFSATMNADGSFFANINGTKDGEKVVSYTVDMQTAKGTDNAFETVDLSQFAK